MPDLHVDRYEVVKLLHARGYSEEQADGFVAALREIDLNGVATKEELLGLRGDMDHQFGALRQDMTEMKAELRREMTDMRAELREEMANMKAEFREEMAEMKTEMHQAIFASQMQLVRWFVPMMLGQAGLIVALVKLL